MSSPIVAGRRPVVALHAAIGGLAALLALAAVSATPAAGAVLFASNADTTFRFTTVGGPGDDARALWTTGTDADTRAEVRRLEGRTDGTADARAEADATSRTLDLPMASATTAVPPRPGQGVVQRTRLQGAGSASGSGRFDITGRSASFGFVDVANPGHATPLELVVHYTVRLSLALTTTRPTVEDVAASTAVEIHADGLGLVFADRLDATTSPVPTIAASQQSGGFALTIAPGDTARLGARLTGDVAASTVPVPAAGLLLASAVAGLGLLRRRTAAPSAAARPT